MPLVIPWALTRLRCSLRTSTVTTTTTTTTTTENGDDGSYTNYDRRPRRHTLRVLLWMHCLLSATVIQTQPAIGHYDAVSTCHDDNICEMRFSICSAPAVWNSLPMTVLNSDSVAVFFPLISSFLSSHFSVAHCLVPSPMKLRPYGVIQICLLLLILF